MEVSPIDSGEDYSGTAEAKFGPVSLSSKLRKNLEYALATGGSTFTLYLASDSLDSPLLRNEARLQITREEVSLQVFDDQGVMDEDKSFRTGYTIDYPMVELHPLDTKRFTITTKRKNGAKRVQLMCVTRQNRDLVVLTLRCLSARKYLLTSKTLQDLFSTDGNQQSQGAAQSAPLDLMLEVDRTVRELYGLMSVNEEVKRERNNLKKELNEIEVDMGETIASYQSMLAANTAPNEQKWKQELDLAIDQKNKLRKQCADAQVEIDQLKQQLQASEAKESAWKNHQEALQIHSVKQSNLESIVEEQNQLISILQKKLESVENLKTELASANAKLLGQSKMIQDLTAQLVDFTTIKQANEQLETDLSQACISSEELNRLKEENAALLGQRSFMGKKIDSLNEEVMNSQQKIEDLTSLQEDTRARHEVAIQKLLTEIEVLENAGKGESDGEGKMKKLEAENQRLQTQCDSLIGQLSRAQALARRSTRSDI